MVELLKYLRGYVRIRVGGFSPERFMNLCSNKGILLWDIVKDGEVYYMNISLKNFWLLRPIVKKTGTKVAVLERYGLPFFMSEMLVRKVFLGGLVLSICFLILSTNYIWDIELEGNYQVTVDMFETLLKENDIYVGMRKEVLDIEALEKTLRREFPTITWASAKLDGTKLLVSIKENDAPILETRQEQEPGMDLVSQFGGTIVEMIVRSGVPKVAIGDVVEEGVILVEGKVPIFNEDTTVREYLYVDSEADILLEHTMNFSTRLPFDYIKQEYTGREDAQRYLRIGDFEIKPFGESPYLVYDSIIRESRPLWFKKLSIPVYFGSITNREYLNVEYEYTLEEAETLLNEKLSTFLASLEQKGVQIMKKNVKIDTNNNSWVLEGEFLVREPVGIGRKTERTEVGEHSTDE